MRQMVGDEVKKVQLGILDCVAKYCEDNKINYWLDSGTLLGAIRHGGYIPWDDDIDIGMPRDDYDRFVREFNESNERYKTYCIDTNPDFYYAHAKVLDTATVLYEPDEKGYKLSVNIDVFVYDNAPEDDEELKKAYDRRDFFRTLSALRTLEYDPIKSVFRIIIKRIIRLVISVFPENYPLLFPF